MSTPSLQSLCDRLPTELAIHILKAGVYNELAFAAKCMVLANWMQQIAAPVLCHIVTIYNSKQANSLLLAIERNLPGMRKTYTPLDLIYSLVVGDDDHKDNRVYGAHIFKTIIALSSSGSYQRLKAPLYLMEFAALTPEVPGLSPCVCYTHNGSLFSCYKYAAVTRLHLVDFSPQMWDIRGLLAIGKGINHLALKLPSNSWAAMSLVDSVTSVSQIRRLVVVVKMQPEEEHLPQLLKMREEPPSWLEGGGLSKVVWEWNTEVEKLLQNEDEPLWNAAEAVLIH